MLQSLATNDLDGWRVVIRVEPTDRSNEFEAITHDLLAGIDHDFKVNDRLEGITRNPFLAIEAAFAAGSKLNLHLEEDFIVSPDATALARWYEREHQEGWLCLSLLAGPCGSAGFLSNAEYPDLLFKARTFNSIGFAMRRAEWEAYGRAAWRSDGPSRSPIIHANWRYNWGWDWSLYGLVAANPALWTIQPALARATHTGREDGTYASPEFHDAAFGKLSINDLKHLDYRLTDVDLLPQDVRSHVLLQDEITSMRLQMENVALGNASALNTVLAPPPSTAKETGDANDTAG